MKSKPNAVIQLENRYYVNLIELDRKVEMNRNHSKHYKLDENNNIISLNISKCNIYNLFGFEEFQSLQELYIFGNNITKIEGLEQLKKLKILDLGENQIERIEALDTLSELNVLDLNFNKIEKMENLNCLNNLLDLILSRNPIRKIENLSNNTNLLNLEIEGTKINNIEGLETLKKLKSLILNDNEIDSINGLTELKNLNYLSLVSNRIEKIEGLNNLIKLKVLDLSDNAIKKIEGIVKLKNLEQLHFKHCQIKNIEGLDYSFKLKLLYLDNNQIEIIKGFDSLYNLRYLDLRNNLIKSIRGLGKLLKLETLSLENNQIKKMENLNSLINLRCLYLDNNQIAKIENVDNLTNLEELSLSENKIYNLLGISDRKSLKILRLMLNKIENIESLYSIEELPLLEELSLFGNPVLEKMDIKLSSPFDAKSHLMEVLSYIKRGREDNTVEIIKPAKVLFLGNHHSGKSTFLEYFLQQGENRSISSKIESTHILNIHYFLNSISNSPLPKAIIYDFGGQDYYHGIYKAFLTNNSINVLFWQKKNDSNKLRTDENKKQLKTQDFNRKYWLYQLSHIYGKSVKENDSQPMLVVQTHADEQERETLSNEAKELNIENEFYISLDNIHLNKKSLKSSLDYFEQTLIEKIEEKQKKVFEPFWYVEFLNFILQFTHPYSITLNKLSNQYKRENGTEYLSNDLEQLSKHGMVLYYPANKKLKNHVWLNPGMTVEYIHNEILSQNQILKWKGKVPKIAFEKDIKEKLLIEVLKENKVIYLDETDKSNPIYIIPGYLPLASEIDEEYFILSDFETPNLILKFENFIPFGFINQLICKYGDNPEKKLYWRDQLLFTSNDRMAKILIQLDFEQLEIKINIKLNTLKLKIEDKVREIFDDILMLYSDLNTSEIFNSLKRIKIKAESDSRKEIYSHQKYWQEFNNKFLPKDLYISLDNQKFVHYQTLEDEEKTSTIITAYSKLEDGKLNKFEGKTQSTISYKKITTNTKIKAMKKIFISYSNKDYSFLEKLKSHLSPFEQLKLIEPWDCTALESGNWHEKIQVKLKEADIVIFLLSANFLESKYIVSEELFPSINALRTNTEKTLLFVVARNFAFNALSSFNSLTGEIDFSNQEEILLELPKHQFIPYQISERANQTKERKLTPINQWKYEEDAYVEIINQIMNYVH